VIVWLWDASGPDGDYAGVTDDEGQALSNAQKLLTKGHATTARVEHAYAHMGGLWIHSGYERTGSDRRPRRQRHGQMDPLLPPRPGRVMNEQNDTPDMDGNDG
jgi:hypothetical protein